MTNTTEFAAADVRGPLRSSPRASPGAIEAVYRTGHWLYTHERVVHASTVFRAMIQIAPEDERGWLALGACHEAQDQRDIALELYETAETTATLAPRCALARARILRSRGQWAETLEALAIAGRMAAELGDRELVALVIDERGRS
jgi:hypothetical protein